MSVATGSRQRPVLIDINSGESSSEPSTPARRIFQGAAARDQAPSFISSERLIEDGQGHAFPQNAFVPRGQAGPADGPTADARPYSPVSDLNEMFSAADDQYGAFADEPAHQHEPTPTAAIDLYMTADQILQKVQEVFPDISHEHVLQRYHQFDQDLISGPIPGQARFDNIIERLLDDGEYPKQLKGKQPLKRKREESAADDGRTKWEAPARPSVPKHLHIHVRAILKADFPLFALTAIHRLHDTHKHLYQTYLQMAILTNTENPRTRRGRPPAPHVADAEQLAAATRWPALLEELQAVRKRVQADTAVRLADDARKQKEAENLQRAIDGGETAECQACFDELPMNRQIHCDGVIAHFTCFTCAETYIKSEIGESRCRVLCTAGCGSGFPPVQLKLLTDQELIKRLAQLQQEKDIRDAGLEDLEECPFCDFKAIAPPLDVDFEFRCMNPGCEKTSCRRCRLVSHIPKSCEEFAHDNKLDSRHLVEEAMTAALVRSCTKCKKPFIKEEGCNKMTCPSCGNRQCYVCSTSITDYNHFEGGRGAVVPAPGIKAKKCPLYDNVEERHEREIKAAADAEKAKIIVDNPDMAPDDMEIKVSDAVQKATQDRMKRARGPGGGGGGYEVYGAERQQLAGPMQQIVDLQRVVAVAAEQRRQARRVRRPARLRPVLPPLQLPPPPPPAPATIAPPLLFAQGGVGHIAHPQIPHPNGPVHRDPAFWADFLHRRAMLGRNNDGARPELFDLQADRPGGIPAPAPRPANPSAADPPAVRGRSGYRIGGGLGHDPYLGAPARLPATPERHPLARGNHAADGQNAGHIPLEYDEYGLAYGRIHPRW